MRFQTLLTLENEFRNYAATLSTFNITVHFCKRWWISLGVQAGEVGNNWMFSWVSNNNIKVPSNLSLSSLTVLMASVMKGVCVFRNEGFYVAASISCNSRNTLLLSANSYFCLSLEGTVVRQFQVYAQDRYVNYCVMTLHTYTVHCMRCTVYKIYFSIVCER